MENNNQPVGLPVALARHVFFLVKTHVPHPPVIPGAADSVVVLSQPDELVTMTTEGHGYGEDVVALL